MNRDRQKQKAFEYHLRLQLMRELHDTLAHLRTIGAAAEELLTEDPSKWRAQIEQIEPNLNEVIRSIREIVAPEPLRKERLIAESAERFLAEIHKFAQKYDASSRQIDIHATLEEITLLTPRQYVHIIRILENCIANAALHAQPSKIKVRLKKKEKNTILKIKDNGAGNERLNNIHQFANELQKSDPLEHQGLGKILHESEKLGAELIVKSSTQTGTTFVFNIPPGAQSL